MHFMNGPRRRLICGVFIGLALVPGQSYASAITVDVVQAAHTTGVATQIYDCWCTSIPGHNVTRSLTSADAVTDLLTPEAGLLATASSDPFSVTVQTEALYPGVTGQPLSLHRAQASATSSTNFRPVDSGIADLRLTLSAQDMGLSHTNTSVSLFDLTTHALIWGYGWTPNGDVYAGLTPILFSDWTLAPSSGGSDSLLLSLPTLLDATHLYQLAFFAETGADVDREVFTTSVSGLRAVPEPASMVLLGTGLALVGLRQRRRAMRSRI
jgi:hypothetical protein